MFWIILSVCMSWEHATFLRCGSLITSTGGNFRARLAWLKLAIRDSRNCFSVYEASVCAKSWVMNSVMVALNNRNSNSVVVLMKNVGAVARRFHQRGVGGIDIGPLGNVFRHSIKAQSGCAHTFLQYRLARKLVREIEVLSQKFGMGQRGFSQTVIPLQLIQARLFRAHGSPDQRAVAHAETAQRGRCNFLKRNSGTEWRSVFVSSLDQVNTILPSGARMERNSESGGLTPAWLSAHSKCG